MIKKIIKYEDFNGVEREEECLFHLSKAELVEMEMGVVGGMEQKIKRIIEAKDTPQIIEVFKELIFKSYGIKSPDGKRLIKSKELSEEFSQTNAYSELFMELATDDKAAAEFINGIMPKIDNNTLVNKKD